MTRLLETFDHTGGQASNIRLVDNASLRRPAGMFTVGVKKALISKKSELFRIGQGRV